MSAILYQLEEIAADVGRLRRRAEPETSIAYALERIADRVESIDSIVCFSAGQLVAEGEAVERAVELVDVRARQLRTLLGEKRR